MRFPAHQATSAESTAAGPGFLRTFRYFCGVTTDRHDGAATLGAALARLATARGIRIGVHTVQDQRPLSTLAASCARRGLWRWGGSASKGVGPATGWELKCTCEEAENKNLVAATTCTAHKFADTTFPPRRSDAHTHASPHDVRSAPRAIPTALRPRDAHTLKLQQRRTTQIFARRAKNQRSVLSSA